MEFRKMEFFFKKWNFEKLFREGNFGKFKNWNFGKLLKNEIWDLKKF